jgi:hypothetical protein
LAQFKALAGELGAELWFSATLPEEELPLRGTKLPSVLAPFAELLAIVIVLEPKKKHVRLRLLKDHECKRVAPTHLELDPKTLLIAGEA